MARVVLVDPPHAVRQMTCDYCGAWLTPLPNEADSQPDPEGWYACTWICPVCRERRELITQHRPEALRASDKDAHDPGTLAFVPWLLDHDLIDEVLAVTAPLNDWDKGAPLPDEPSLMDHAGWRKAPWGRVEGPTEDPVAIRAAVAALRLSPPRRGATRSPEIVDLVEYLVLLMGYAYDLMRTDTVFNARPRIRQTLDSLVCVGPVIAGAGSLSISRRLHRWRGTHRLRPNHEQRPLPSPGTPECAWLEQRLAHALELEAALHLAYSADTQRELDSDCDRIEYRLGLLEADRPAGGRV